MYLPKFKQKVGGKVPGILKDLVTGRRYTGKFVRDHLGNYYKGTSITSKSEKLELVQDTQADKEAGFYSEFVSPTPDDYRRGYMVRYFAKDGRNGKIIELKKRSYILKQQETKLYIRTAKAAWNISGTPEDQIINGYLYPGVKSKNAEVVRLLEKDLPGIGEQVLKDLGQFVK